MRIVKARNQKRDSKVMSRRMTPEIANAQCLSPVGHWAFYTVFCTALFGTLTQGNASCLAAVRSWLGLAAGIIAQTASRCKGQHGTNRDIWGIPACDRGKSHVGGRPQSGIYDRFEYAEEAK
jgi:hypothetical protein